jgi:hypothetical protein
VRHLGRLERVSTVPSASAAQAVAISGGRVFVNDISGRRVLLLDSTLAVTTVVADTTGATANAYGRQAGTLIRFRGDSVLFIDPASLSMLVLGPTGKPVRVLAIPRSDDAQMMIGNVFGIPGFDARGRFLYRGGDPGGSVILCCVGRAHATPARPAGPLVKPDTGFILRVDLASRSVDTAASIKIETNKQSINADGQGFFTSLEIARNPLPVIDDWTVMSDGSVAVVRGRDYHIDWLSVDGRWTSSLKMPFEWQRLEDQRKQTLIDSSAKAMEAELEGVNRTLAGATGSRGGRGGAATLGGVRTGMPIPMIAGRLALSDLPDYAPPFTAGAVQADADGNLWIRTSTVRDGQPVYDIVNRRGELFDRVQLPSFRTIAGFGPGVVYMAVKDSAGVVHLERARVK